ncbi:MAG: hypothetical protein ACYCZR_01105 [Burkholderiales bacterium]
MSPKEFLKGWFTLIAQPWGARYEGESDVATAQQELYFATFKTVDPDKWLKACYAIASKSREWPSISTVKALVDPSGHPGTEQAWAIVAPKVASDTPTIFVTGPMREAYGAALALESDMVAARMAFKETYAQAVTVDESAGIPPSWSIIPGTDPRMKELAITEAVKKGIANADWAMRQLPVEVHPSILQIVNQTHLKRIAS